MKDYKISHTTDLEKLYEYLTLENVAYTLQAIDEAVECYNISMNWNEEKFITLQPYNNNTWMVNAYDTAENLFFRRHPLDHRYFTRISRDEL